jgi:hypothetical protein
MGPVKLHPKEPFSLAYKINGEFLEKGSLKVSFYIVVHAEIDKVIDIHSEVEGWFS